MRRRRLPACTRPRKYQTVAAVPISDYGKASEALEEVQEYAKTFKGVVPVFQRKIIIKCGPVGTETFFVVPLLHVYRMQFLNLNMYANNIVDRDEYHTDLDSVVFPIALHPEHLKPLLQFAAFHNGGEVRALLMPLKGDDLKLAGMEPAVADFLTNLGPVFNRDALPYAIRFTRSLVENFDSTLAKITKPITKINDDVFDVSTEGMDRKEIVEFLAAHPGSSKLKRQTPAMDIWSAANFLGHADFLLYFAYLNEVEMAPFRPVRSFFTHQIIGPDVKDDAADFDAEFVPMKQVPVY